MSAVNPYTPPQADVADIQATRFSQPRVWAYSGRIGRLRYLAYLMGGYLVFALTMGLVGALAAGTRGSAFYSVVIAAGAVVYLVQYVLAGIQRAHDMDWSGWSVLLAFVPLVSLIWIFKAGSAGDNRFGAPPPPNTLGIKLLAWIMPAIFLVGILAAIALPAYQSYVMRAKAAQSGTH